ncbi:flagellar motor protein MotD [Pseudomonas aeruginosa]|nr:flagellar motor protein MotD [Pseudomonas aeruginosa]
MQRRRRHQEEHENHERWLVSYADFITLLFAFFVVMYSISSINEGKYKILSETLTGVFNQPDRSLKPIPIGDERPRTTEPERTSVEEQPSDNAASADSLERIADSVRDAFGDLIASDQLSVRGNELWIEITLNSSLLFPSGDALPNDAAFDIVEKVAKILAPYKNPIHVEGFTDDVPIHSPRYPHQLGTVGGAGGEHRPPARQRWGSSRRGWLRWAMVNFSRWRTMPAPRGGRRIAGWCW